jgi:dTDP-4-amino-4,6-dideoxygalactose transaminase
MRWGRPWAAGAPPAPRIKGAFYKFYAYVDGQDDLEHRRDAVLAEIAGLGLKGLSGSCSEVYKEAAFHDLQASVLPVAKELGQASLMFEVHPTLDPHRLRDRAAAVAQVTARALA